MTKEKIVVYSKEFSLDSRPLSRVIQTIGDLAAKFGEDAELQFNGDYEGDTSCRVRQCRLETEDEYAERLDHEAKSLASDKANRKLQFEKLKIEFENDC